MKKCHSCGNIFSEDNFGKHSSRPDGLEYRCKTCAKEKDRNKYLKNKDKIKEQKSDYYREHKEEILKKKKEDYSQENIRERILKTNQKYYQTEKGKNVRRLINIKRRTLQEGRIYNFKKENWEYSKDYFDHKCAFCGNEEILTKDHLLALSNGGDTVPENIIPACKSCNSSKNDTDFMMWYLEQKFFDVGRLDRIWGYLGSFKREVA